MIVKKVGYEEGRQGETHKTSMLGFNTQEQENLLNQEIVRNNGTPQAKKLGEVQKKTQLKYLYMNARHLGNKIEELKLLMQEVKPDDIGITETWWNNIHDRNTGNE